MRAVVLDNVQFIYELALAELELRALGGEVAVSNGLREFELGNATAELRERLVKRTAYFQTIGGQETYYSRIIRRNRTKSVNQYLTHWIYPYKGKFHPQMVRALLNVIGLGRGDTVLDPFIGSGTTALEAQLLGINCIGLDISPLCVLQSRVKTGAIYALGEILSGQNSEGVRDFYALAELLGKSDAARRRRKSAKDNVKLMLASVGDYHEVVTELGLELGRVEVRQGDARATGLADSSVDGIITSPPYSIALDYIENDAHALEGLCDLEALRETCIGVRGSGQARLKLYEQDMEQVYREMRRVLRPRGYAAIIIGDATYQGRPVRTVEFTIECLTGLGFELVGNIPKVIFGLYNVMKNENVLIFRSIKNSQQDIETNDALELANCP